MKVFAKRFYGFDPMKWPVISFGTEGARSNLLRQSRPGDLMLVVGTKTKETAKEDQGRLLGLAEFGRQPVETLALVAREDTRPDDWEGDRFRWPKSLPIVRAWKFDHEPPPLLLDVLTAQLPMSARTIAVPLDGRDTAAVLALPRHEVAVRETEALAKARAIADALTGRTLTLIGPTTGPRPAASGTSTVTRTEADRAFTYCFRFGTRLVWKIGRARDVEARLREVNTHVPHEALGERWSLHMLYEWTSESLAHDMEQRVLTFLRNGGHPSEGERVQCSESQLEAAWRRGLIS